MLVIIVLKVIVVALVAHYYLCKPNINRAVETAELAINFIENELQFTELGSVGNAIKKAKNNSMASDAIFIGGSTFVVAEITGL